MLPNMVELRIREVAERKGIKTAYGLQKAMNVPPMTAARLWKAKMGKIALKTIDALCEALDCDPCDLVVRVTDKKKQRGHK
ncbi:MAG: helix-turn-helix domain-containing protein [Pyrinomonadaceae bacterium]